MTFSECTLWQSLLGEDIQITVHRSISVQSNTNKQLYWWHLMTQRPIFWSQHIWVSLIWWSKSNHLLTSLTNSKHISLSLLFDWLIEHFVVSDVTCYNSYILCPCTKPKQQFYKRIIGLSVCLKYFIYVVRIWLLLLQLLPIIILIKMIIIITIIIMTKLYLSEWKHITCMNSLTF